MHDDVATAMSQKTGALISHILTHGHEMHPAEALPVPLDARPLGLILTENGIAAASPD